MVLGVCPVRLETVPTGYVTSLRTNCRDGHPNHSRCANCTTQLETYLRTYKDGRNHLRPYTVFLYRGILPKQRAMGSDIDTPVAGKSVDREAYAAEEFI